MILSNQVKCHNCGEAPWSAHRHDFVQCACITEAERVCVDGGMDYLRRVHGPESDYTDISISMPERHVEALMDIIDGKEKSTFGKVCEIARYLRDEMDINVTMEEDGE
jgi:hypothetical protein